MKKYYHLFIVVSFVFVAFALAKIDYLSLPRLHSPVLLGLSMLLLCLGFVAEARVWKVTCGKFGCPISLKDSFSSIGLSVFGKYIPGKIWLIMGRAGYLNQHHSYSVKKLAYIALVSQLLIIWMGLGIGLIAVWNLSFVPEPGKWGLVALWLISSLIMIHPFVHKKAAAFVRQITRGRVELPVLNFRDAVALIPTYLVRWILFSASFYCAMQALSEVSLPWYAATIFPLAGTIGLFVFFLPGGIGVREGIIVFFLVQMGLDTASSVGLSVASRLWIVTGEIATFLVGFSLRRKPSQPLG